MQAVIILRVMSIFYFLESIHVTVHTHFGSCLMRSTVCFSLECNTAAVYFSLVAQLCKSSSIRGVDWLSIGKKQALPSALVSVCIH